MYLNTHMSDLPVADLKKALAEHKGVIKEGQTRALSAQQQLQEAQSLVEQLSKALEVKDTMLAAVQVLRHVPCIAHCVCSTVQRGRLLVCRSLMPSATS